MCSQTLKKVLRQGHQSIKVTIVFLDVSFERRRLGGRTDALLFSTHSITDSNNLCLSLNQQLAQFPI